MVVNLRRYRRKRADETGRTWTVGQYRRDMDAMRKYRCFFNGQEITDSTFYCDTRRGVARIFLRDHNGHIHIDRDKGGPMWMELRGHVQLRRKTEQKAVI